MRVISDRLAARLVRARTRRRLRSLRKRRRGSAAVSAAPQPPPQPQERRRGRAHSCTPISPPAITSAARWTSRSRSSPRRPRSIPNYAQAYNVYGLVYTVLRRQREGASRTSSARSRSRRTTRISITTGAGTCAAQTRDASRSRKFEQRRAQSAVPTPEIALVNAGAAASTIGDMRARREYFRRALAARPGQRAGELRARAASRTSAARSTRRAAGCGA